MGCRHPVLITNNLGRGSEKSQTNYLLVLPWHLETSLSKEKETIYLQEEKCIPLPRVRFFLNEKIIIVGCNGQDGRLIFELLQRKAMS